MRTIETTATITPEHTLTVSVPTDIPAGTVRVVVQIQQVADLTPSKLPFNLIPIETGPWPAGYTVRREQLYGDSGR